MVLITMTIGNSTRKKLKELAENNNCRQRDILTIAINELAEQTPGKLEQLKAKYYLD